MASTIHINITYIFPEEVEVSEYETLACSESDRESEYMTGVEDFLEVSTEAKKPRKRKRVLPPVSEIITSSFIQNILFEDSRAGVEVVDLFVAVKNAKDKLEYLAKCNNDISLKLNDLNEEAKVFKKEYGVFLGNVENFMAKMNADHQFRQVLMPQIKPNAADKNEKTSKTAVNESKDKRQSIESAKKCEAQKKRNKRPRCKSCGTEEVQNHDRSDSPECRKADSCRGETTKTQSCLGCFMSSLKKNSFNKLPVFSEAFLGSLAASLFWLQKKQERSRSKSRSSSPVEFPAEGNKGAEFLQLKDSTVQMIRDVCEIVKEAPCGANGQLFLKEAEETDDFDLELSSGASCESVLEESYRAPDINPKGARKEIESDAGHVLDDISCIYSGENSSSKLQTSGKEALKKSKSENASKLKASGRIKEGQNSDSEEQSAADPLATSTYYDLRAKPSVTCMGDLTSSLTKKKSSGALSSAISVMPSWIEKLSTEIISKLKNIKPKTNVKAFEQPYEKSDLALQALTGYLEFTVKANTPMGVLDFNVVHYNKNPSLKDRLLKFNSVPGQVSSGPKPTPASQLSGRMSSIKEDSYSWSEESFRNTESDGVSNSGESELEEFVQIFLECPKKSTKKENMLNTPQVKGILKEAELKIGKSHFFEIQKCYPVYQVEDLLQMTPKIQRGVRPEVKKMVSEEKTLSVNAGEKCESQLVIEGSSTDLVIYIQVEVEDGVNTRQFDDGVTVEYHTAKTANKEKTIRLDERKASGFSLYSIWKGEDYSTDLEKSDRLIALEEMQFEEDDVENELIDEEEKVVMVKEPKEKSVTFNDELSEIYIEKQLEETIPEEETSETEVLSTAKNVSMKDEKQRVNIWFQQKCSIPVERGETRKAVLPVEDKVETLCSNSMELERALKLIREIESDVVEVKLGDAISILPRLEMELRKHLQGKLKDLGEREFKSKNSQHNFFSTIDIWPEDESVDTSENSEDRLNSLLIMLSNLEDAVKSIENSSSNIELSQSSKIYKLLQALTVSIREMEEEPSVISLSQTMDIASQLDTAVREYDSIVRKQPMDYIKAPKDESKGWKMNSNSIEKVPEQQHLRNVRKKVFEILEEEAIDVEGRIDRDFDRLDRLGRENDEALMFLEAFLQKTQRRLLELSNLKAELKELSHSMNVLYETAKEKFARKKEMEAEMRVIHLKDVEERSTTTNSSVTSFGPSPEPVRQTVSGLLIALDTLKSKAKEKKEFYKELLHPGRTEKSEEADGSSQRSSRSSFTTKHPESLRTFIREFKKIGDTSLYLSWTKPEGPLMESVVGYQIHVNGKLNQKVRNPRRLQAVLYSVDLTNKAEIQLYAIAENGPRILLATLSHQNE